MSITSMLKKTRSLAILLVLPSAYAQTVKFVQIVLQAVPVESLTISPTIAAANSSVRFDVNVSGVPAAAPTGTITFTLISASGAPALLSVSPISNGVASWTTTPPPGDYTISATYSGDVNYRAYNISSVGTVSSPPGDFDFTVPTLTIKQGQTWTGTIPVISLNGFAQAVTFRCVAPSALGCVFPHATYSLGQAGSSSTGIPLTVSAYPGQFTTAFLFIVTGVFLPDRFRRIRKWVSTAALSFCFFVVVGCGTSGSAGWQAITPKGTYQTEIIGISGSLQHTKQLTVIVE